MAGSISALTSHSLLQNQSIVGRRTIFRPALATATAVVAVTASRVCQRCGIALSVGEISQFCSFSASYFSRAPLRFGGRVAFTHQAGEEESHSILQTNAKPK
jgi:hypothetical protein